MTKPTTAVNALYDQQKYQRLQLLTVRDLLEGRARFEYPSSRQINVTFKKAPKAPAASAAS